MPSAPTRMDIACFVGFIARRRSQAIPTEIRAWLNEKGWISRRDGQAIEDLLDLPVPISNWDTFHKLFHWDKRPLDGKDQFGHSYMGVAVRSYFAQGGRKCYVIRVGDPWPLSSFRRDRMKQLSKLIPGFNGTVPDSSLFDASPRDRTSWKGVAHIFGLPDVSFLCLPDLAEAVAIDREVIDEGLCPPPTIKEQFVECSSQEPLIDSQLKPFRAPRCDSQGFHDWAVTLQLLSQDVISRWQREIQLVCAIPIPTADALSEGNMLRFFTNQHEAVPPSSSISETDQQKKVPATAFLQLAFPWARTTGSGFLPEQLESPDGILAGILAKNALTRSTYRSAANLQIPHTYDLYPELSRKDLTLSKINEPPTIIERVSLFGRTPSGIKLLSDVTTSLNEDYRSASVNRLVSVIVRTARLLGEDLVFESSGERLWKRLQVGMETLLVELWQDGALRGQSNEAFHVRCDRSTMTQDDIDNGRMVAIVQFQAAQPIQEITVVLAMDEGGHVELISTEEDLVNSAV